MTSRTCAARRAIAVLGTIVVIALAMACGDDGQAGPAGPSVVDAPPTTSTSPSAGTLVDVAGGSSGGQRDASGAGVNDLDLPGQEGVVRTATRSDAMIAKPVITQVARAAGNSQLTVEWGVTSTTDIVDYRVQWSPGCIASWNRRLGAESVFVRPSNLSFVVAVIDPAGGNLFHRAFKDRVRARIAANTATHRKGGPWSDSTILYPGNPTDSLAFCKVGDRAQGEFGCDANIGGSLAVLDINGTLDAELEPGGGHATLTATHAAGASIGLGGFSVEAHTSPNAWEIVSLDREWRDYC